jgi:MFS transporter, ACS family, D-galactonate transporter
MMGLTSGISSFAASLAGILTPLAVGYLVGDTGSFYWALAYNSAMALLGACSYMFLLGPIRRIELD